MSSRSLLLARLSLVSLLTLILSLPAFADSQIRMVRLSLVEGDVEAGHHLSVAYEKALLNAPLVQGMTLKTGAGRAEVEFEDGSTVRLGPQTLLEFTTLSRRDSGALVSTMTVDNGLVYVDYKGEKYVKASGGELSGSKDEEFSVLLGQEVLQPGGQAHFRIMRTSVKADIGMFSGEVAVEGPSGNFEISKKQSASLNLLSNHHLLAKKVETDPLDAWDKEQTDYHDRYLLASSGVTTGSPYAYGMSDLSYYGGFFDMPGYGLLWQPYFIGAGWNPFMYGAWLGDPCFNSWIWNASCGGYTWISGYPWGWLPYHYGTWIYLGNQGWAWQPGGFQAWQPIAPVRRAPQSFVLPHPPSGVVNGPVFVDHRPPILRTSFNRMAISRLTIRNGSAGLGVPRGAVRNLSSVSQRVESKGFATVGVRQMPATGWNGQRPTFSRTQGVPMPPRGQTAPERSAPRMGPPPASHPSFAPPPSFGGRSEDGFPPAGGATSPRGAPRK
jgi:Family of unknown function (DUF6600)